MIVITFDTLRLAEALLIQLPKRMMLNGVISVSGNL